jgi:hypothetical protein
MECKVCLGPHDRAIHDATRRVHEWLKRRLLFKLGAVPVIEPLTQLPYRPSLACVPYLQSPASKRKRETCPNQK